MKELAALLCARARGYASSGGAGELEGFLRFAEARRADLARELEDEGLASLLAAEAVRAVERSRQFAASDPALHGKLEPIFASSLTALRARLSAEGELAREIERIFDSEAQRVGAVLAAALSAEATVCAEYSLELQLELLGVTLAELAAPILDLGCGRQARLVHRCRAEGISAIGLDRHAEGPHTLRADWLAHSFPAATYGTILSHQAFSLHFLHHHLAPGASAEAYARKYMELLGALKPGGRFVYVPGLPFVERHLSATSFRAEQRPLPSPLREAVDSGLGARVGASVAYASSVTRLDAG